MRISYFLSLAYLTSALLTCSAIPSQAEYAIQTAPGISTQYKISSATFVATITADSGVNLATAFDIKQHIEILVELKPEAAHVNQTGAVYTVARYKNQWFAQGDDSQWHGWNQQLDSLKSLVNWHPLQATEQRVVTTNLSELPGNFEIYVGYQVSDDVHYGATPFTFSVTDNPQLACLPPKLYQNDQCIVPKQIYSVTNLGPASTPELIGPKGGIVRMSHAGIDYSLEIQPYALEQETPISMTPVAIPNLPGAVAIRLKPSGLQFKIPAHLIMSPKPWEEPMIALGFKENSADLQLESATQTSTGVWIPVPSFSIHGIATTRVLKPIVSVPEGLIDALSRNARAPIKLSAGAEHTCYVKGDTSVTCWGLDSNKQASGAFSPLSLSGTPPTSLNSAVEVAAGAKHSCARLSDRTIRCWGANDVGQFGNGSQTAPGGTSVTSFPPPLVSGISTATALVAGANHNCAILTDGTIKCWGKGDRGQLGNNAAPAFVTTPVLVQGITTAIDIAAGANHTCALLADTTIKCWGDNTFRQLGSSNTESFKTTPVSVTSLTNVVELAAGEDYNCARKAGGTILNPGGSVICWGRNTEGQLGIGNVASPVNNAQTPVRNITTAVAIDLGRIHSCARLSDGTIKCWGRKSSGLLGFVDLNASDSTVFLPNTPVQGITTARAVSAGSGHSCAQLRDLSVKCWGNNNTGQLEQGFHNGLASDGFSLLVSPTPRTVIPAP